MFEAQLGTADRYLSKIFPAGLFQWHKQDPRLYVWYDHIRQTTATCRNMESNIQTLNCMPGQFLPVVHMFCIFWCIHQMYSATIAQSSSKYCRPYYLLRSLFLISCFLVSLCCSAHAYALTMRLYNLVITLFSAVFGPNIELLTQMLCRSES